MLQVLTVLVKSATHTASGMVNTHSEVLRSAYLNSGS